MEFDARDGIEAIAEYLRVLGYRRVEPDRNSSEFPPHTQDTGSGDDDYHSITTGAGEPLPYLNVNVPAQRQLALNVIAQIITFLCSEQQRATRSKGIVLWLVPTVDACNDILACLRDRAHEIHRHFDHWTLGSPNISTLGERIKKRDLLDALSIFVLRFPPTEQKEIRQLYDDIGGYGYESFFPDENLNYLHRRLLDRVPNLDHYEPTPGIPWDDVMIKTSLANVFRVTKPIAILDEWGGGTFNDEAIARACDLNPSLLVRFTPTPGRIVLREDNDSRG
ncbi:hypothetical protein JI721_11955 [Alicyclobacillus cycloheptanicus]|uniref:Uncharacterized protein n=1 Tax=Alicyclobacillus cycloheptanicus TaxID=1457 RepID=A0ABT9XG31_9BACL|nr:hypothetical protein [Alicyclobacillus cycloheptanicus]MDQ0189250.1 hypothetical protein [Alicyclobacillus cycloheptanicus]WDM00433.1 hypothetical protein JI721_11955 [Alicyclobacillus cycloheptanicus]